MDWFAQQAGLSLVSSDIVPPGTFNYIDDRTYSPTEALDLLNSVLLTKGYTLVRRERMLVVVNLEDPIPPDLITEVKPEELDSRGQYELLKVTFNLDKMGPDQAELELKKLMGPQGNMVVLPSSRQVVVTETGGRLRNIRDMIQHIEHPTGTAASQVHAYDLRRTVPQNVMDQLRQLLDILPDRYATADGTLHFALDAVNQRLLVTGNPDKMARVDEILQALNVPSVGAGTVSGFDEAPQLEVYTISSADSDSVLKVLQTLMNGVPDVRLAIDPKSGNLVAFRGPASRPRSAPRWISCSVNRGRWK